MLRGGELCHLVISNVKEHATHIESVGTVIKVASILQLNKGVINVYLSRTSCV